MISAKIPIKFSKLILKRVQSASFDFSVCDLLQNYTFQEFRTITFHSKWRYITSLRGHFPKMYETDVFLKKYRETSNWWWVTCPVGEMKYPPLVTDLSIAQKRRRHRQQILHISSFISLDILTKGTFRLLILLGRWGAMHTTRCDT